MARERDAKRAHDPCPDASRHAKRPGELTQSDGDNNQATLSTMTVKLNEASSDARTRAVSALQQGTLRQLSAFAA
jgi:hypothetical protein